MSLHITQSILHVLDTNIDFPVLSESSLLISPVLEEYLIGHMERTWNCDDCRQCSFLEYSKILDYFEKIPQSFLEITKDISSNIFVLMKQNPAIPCADLVCALVENEGESYFVLLKMNYKESFIHYFEAYGESKINSIIHQRTSLPLPKAKIDEAFFVNLQTKEIQLVEKKYEIDGKKDFYLSSSILQCHLGLSEKQKLSTVKKAVEVINDRFFDNPKEIETHVTTVLCNQAIEENEVTIEDLCEEFYGDSPAIRQEFENAMKGQNIQMTEKLKVSPSAARKMEKQSIKTMSGVEIKIPIYVYENNDSLEFINNPDGSISLLIKGVIL